MFSLTNLLKKRRFLSFAPALVLIIVFLSSIAFRPVLADEKPRVVDPHFYSLEKNGKLSFVLGTIHFGVDMEEFPGFVTEALAHQKLFVSEATKSTKSEEKQRDNFSSLPSGVKTSLLLRGMSKKDINSYRPDTLCMVYLYWDYLDADIENKYVLDGQFEQYAISKEKKLRELDLDEKLMDETIEELFECDLTSFIEQFPVDSVSFLLDKIQKESRDRYRSVGEQDLDNKGEVDSTTLRRNESWIPLIENYHREGFFAVVGAAHLDPYHEKGLLSLLRARGFNVTRISNEQRFRGLLKKFDN